MGSAGGDGSDTGVDDRQMPHEDSILGLENEADEVSGGRTETPADLVEGTAKRSSRVLPWVVASVMVALGIAGLWTYDAIQEANAEKAVMRAEAHFEAAAAGFEKVGSVSKEMLAPGADYLKLAAEVRSECSSAAVLATRELDAAQKDIESLRPSDARADYLASIAAVRQAVQSLRQLNDDSVAMVTFCAAVDEWSKVASEGDTLFSEATDAVLEEHWNVGAGKARAAARHYSRAKTMASDLDGDYPGYGADHLVRTADLYASAMNELVDVCGAAKVKSSTRAQKAVEAYTSYLKRARKIGAPDYQTDSTILFGPLLEDFQEITAQSEKADQLHQKAIDVLLPSD